MATSDSPLSVPNVTLAVARGASSGNWTEGQSPVIQSVTGATTHRAAATVAGSNFSTHRQSPLLWTDFEGMSIGGVVADSIAEFSQAGDGDPTSAKFLASTDGPLFGNRVAKAEAVYKNLSGLQFATGGTRSLFSEYHWRSNIRYWPTTSAGDSADGNFKIDRISAEAFIHTTPPFLGCTLFGTTWQASFQVARGSADIGAFGTVGYGEVPSINQWHRHTSFLKVSDPGVSNGKRYYKTSYGNPGSPSAGVGFSKNGDNNLFDADEGVTLLAEEPLTLIQSMLLGFFQRTSTDQDLSFNDVYYNETEERVVLTNNPKWTADTAFDYVSCPTSSRANGEISFTSLIDRLPVGAVYLYVVNQDGLANSNGHTVRAA